MILPTVAQCDLYFKEYHVPKNIYRHCMFVRQVAVFLAGKLRDAGVAIDVDFVDRLAYLHDLFKMVVIEDFGRGAHGQAQITKQQAAFWQEFRQKFPNMNEGQVAAQVFGGEFPLLARSLDKCTDPRDRQRGWEEIVVHYADWRSLKETLVTLDERRAYLEQRYPHNDGRWGRYTDFVMKEEAKIFERLDFTAQQLEENMNNG